MRRIISTFLSALLFIFAVKANVSDNIMLDSDSEVIASATLSSFIDNARSGNTEAQRLAGLCYLYGNGVDSNRSEAWKWIAKSASSGDHVSQYYLGVFYMSGWCV